MTDVMKYPYLSRRSQQLDISETDRAVARSPYDVFMADRFDNWADGGEKFYFVEGERHIVDGIAMPPREDFARHRIS
ncbi:hypothetical protein VSX64_19035 [Aurantimonas sp. C2-6-R+9]|uniref:hypothetical protein n=1 Tax=unclassified Aurantimonas TaxID=2638230 RepID=UPI002E190763|nr:MULTISPECIES: hypothetical protein [unclassified Aurantimonas]MEC5292717.1 hypothetical protein [Aurantimonas sp. C2-3-R2]MEC5382936.1 hypothetical protein [Aurantimonas sp. C2-6-R+9]MEC5413751.1 hypothetical protein [Aurantimonas sp. C2-4-R8]